MANNRLYILDPATGERFLLCKSMGEGWGVWTGRTDAPAAEALDRWLASRDVQASYGNCAGKPTTLLLVTEYDGPNQGG